MYHTMYQVEVTCVEVEQIHKKIQSLSTQCDMIEQKLLATMKLERERLYEQQHQLVEHMANNVVNIK